MAAAARHERDVGDDGGISDLQESLRLALARNSSEAPRAYLNLGTAHSHFGELAETFRIHEEVRYAHQSSHSMEARWPLVKSWGRYTHRKVCSKVAASASKRSEAAASGTSRSGS